MRETTSPFLGGELAADVIPRSVETLQVALVPTIAVSMEEELTTFDDCEEIVGTAKLGTPGAATPGCAMGTCAVAATGLQLRVTSKQMGTVFVKESSIDRKSHNA
jgi:hypothetical protein